MAERAFDPICDMIVEKDKAAATAEYQGKTYYFCAPGCKVAFEREPEKYVDKVAEWEAQQ
jgi:YHS domain-containing protein